MVGAWHLLPRVCTSLRHSQGAVSLLQCNVCVCVCLYDRCSLQHTCTHINTHTLSLPTSAVTDTCQNPLRASRRLETERFPRCSKTHCWQRGGGPFINRNFGLLSHIILHQEPEQRGEEEVGRERESAKRDERAVSLLFLLSLSKDI